jgi:hypothetical protein
MSLAMYISPSNGNGTLDRRAGVPKHQCNDETSQRALKEMKLIDIDTVPTIKSKLFGNNSGGVVELAKVPKI